MGCTMEGRSLQVTSFHLTFEGHTRARAQCRPRHCHCGKGEAMRSVSLQRRSQPVVASNVSPSCKAERSPMFTLSMLAMDQLSAHERQALVDPKILESLLQSSSFKLDIKTELQCVTCRTSTSQVSSFAFDVEPRDGTFCDAAVSFLFDRVQHDCKQTGCCGTTAVQRRSLVSTPSPLRIRRTSTLPSSPSLLCGGLLPLVSIPSTRGQVSRGDICFQR